MHVLYDTFYFNRKLLIKYNPLPPVKYRAPKWHFNCKIIIDDRLVNVVPPRFIFDTFHGRRDSFATETGLSFAFIDIPCDQRER